MLVRPGHRIPVDVDPSQYDERNCKRNADADQQTLSPLRLPEKYLAKAVAAGHHCEPWKQRVCDKHQALAQLENSRLKKYNPKRSKPTKLGSWETGQQVVASHQGHAEPSQPGEPQGK